MDAIKDEMGVPQGVRDRCHTALVDRYLVEGHVPAADLRRLLRERPRSPGSRSRACRRARRAWRVPVRQPPEPYEVARASTRDAQDDSAPPSTSRSLGRGTGVALDRRARCPTS